MEHKRQDSDKTVVVNEVQKSLSAATIDEVESQTTKGNGRTIHARVQRLCSAVRRSNNAVQTFLTQCGDRWVWEILGCCLALCCLVSIIIILAVNHDTTLADKGAISINAWVSIFTAVMKAAIMLVIAEGLCQLKWLWFEAPRPLIDMERFDSASRGPWGSFLLLLSFRPHHLARLGALLSVVALAIDPFSQQIIQYYSCFPVSSHHAAKLSRANNYTADAIPRGPGNAELNTTLSTAITIGAMPYLPINATDILPVECSSGNCTFPSTDAGEAFQTIGLCHECWDIADLIRVNNTNSSSGWSLANWKSFDGWNWGDRPAYVGENTVPYEPDNSTNAMYWSRKSLALRPDFDDLITIDGIMLNVDDDCNVQQSEKCPKHPWAFRCALYPCVMTMGARIVNSELQEQVLATTPLRKTNSSAIEVTTSTNLTWSLASESILRNGSWSDCTVTDSPTPDSLIAISPENRTLFSGRSAAVHGELPQYYQDECVWTLGYDIALGINQYLSWMFDPSDTAPYVRNSVMNTFSTRGPQQMKAIYRAGKANLETTDAFFTILTGFITSMMRQHGDGAPAVGFVLESQTCIGVEWGWISLPVLMILCGVGFFVATAVQSGRKGVWVGAWRSSAVVPVLAGMNADVGWRSEVERLAEKVEVSVAKRDGRWSLVRA